MTMPKLDFDYLVNGECGYRSEGVISHLQLVKMRVLIIFLLMMKSAQIAVSRGW